LCLVPGHDTKPDRCLCTAVRVKTKAILVEFSSLNKI
jgi:hypothetical protein